MYRTTKGYGGYLEGTNEVGFGNPKTNKGWSTLN
jgi:hypothetical protein